MITYSLSNDVTAFTTTREGGFSINNYASFNVNRYCGDNPEHVKANQQSLCKSLGISIDRLIMPHQIHKTNVALIDNNFLTLNREKQTEKLAGIDALISEEKNIALCISTADCVPVLIYDTKNHAIAAIHAGWRGTVQRIVEITLYEMHNQFGTNGEDCKAVIGPSISLDSFEVGEEVYKTFVQSKFDMEKIAKKYYTHDNNYKWHIDLWECNKIQLMNKKVYTGNIYITGICTYINSDKFFSARKLGIKSGRLLTGIILK